MGVGIFTLCALCGAVLVNDPPGPRGEISHGICESCLRLHKHEYGLTNEDIEEILAECEAEQKLSRR